MTSLGWLRHAAVLLAVMVVAAGCSSPEERIDQSTRTARSWSATAQRTSDALAAGAVPRVYARQVLRTAIDGKRQLARQPEWRSMDRNTRGYLEDAIRKLAASLGDRPDSLPPP